MSSEQQLTRRVPFRQSALDKARFAGVVTLADLPRTRDAVTADSGAPVEVSVAFDEDTQRRVIVSGGAKTSLTLACQRCLEPTERAMAIDVDGIVVVSDAEAAAVPRAWEPIMADSETLDLHALIDDELILALPMTVQCDRPECRAAYESKQETSEPAPTREKPNPFAVLSSLKSDDDESR